MCSKNTQNQVLSHFDHPPEADVTVLRLKALRQRTRPEKLWDLVITISLLLAPFCRKSRIREERKKKKKKKIFVGIWIIY